MKNFEREFEIEVKEGIDKFGSLEFKILGYLVNEESAELEVIKESRGYSELNEVLRDLADFESEIYEDYKIDFRFDSLRVNVNIGYSI